MPALTNRRPDVARAIDDGLDYLDGMQLPTGAFRMFRSPHPLLEEHCEPDHSPFPASLVAHCLHFVASPQSAGIVAKAIRFLSGAMESGGVWRYWSLRLGYVPPDLDDTACISFLLRRHGVSIPDNTGVMLGNRDARGLFYTWVLPRPLWTTEASYWRVALREIVRLPRLYYLCKHNECKPDDLDAVVNANVLHYLGERPETRAIVRHLIRVIEEESEESADRYYGSRFSLYYFLSRNHAAGIRGCEPVGPTVVTRIKSFARADGSIGSHVLHTALAACALMDWDDRSAVLDAAISSILHAKESSGGWKRCPIYFSGHSKTLTWGSEEITTGFCLEALARYRDTRIS